MKVCTKCGVEKSVDEFFARKGATDGKMSSCKQCKTKAIYAWREDNRDKWNAYCVEMNKLPEYKETKKARLNRPEVKERERELQRIRRQSPEYKAKRAEHEKKAHVVAYRKSYKQKPNRKLRTKELAKRPEKILLRRNWSRNRYVNDPKFRLDLRMSNSIGQAVRKNYRSWESLVGYTGQQLMDHLEKQFLKGMTWENYGEWHIDHIIPKSTFNYTCAEDKEFKECWSLSNLRPLWGPDNLSKNDKILFLC